MRSAARRRDGYSLMEAIVALFVLAVAATGLITATQAHIDGVRRLEDGVVGQWIAENRLAELSIADPASERIRMMNRDWTVRVERRATEDPDLQSVQIVVSRAGQESGAARLNGFVDAGGGS